MMARFVTYGIYLKIWLVLNTWTHLIADPNGTQEDEGVLVTIVFDGEKEKSYLLILDASNFTVIDKSYLPHNIPWSAHGMHFPEAKWTLNQK